MLLDIAPWTAMSISFSCLSISFGFLVLRLYVHLRHLKFLTTQDYLLVAAWLSFLGRCLTDYFVQQWGFWHPEITYTPTAWPNFEKYVAPGNLERGFRLGYSSVIFYYSCIYCVKASFFLLFLKTFPKSMVKLRRALWFTIVFNVLGLTAVILMGLFYCLPVRRNWSLDPMQRCLSWSTIEVFFFSTGFNIVSDLMVYILPFFLLPTLYRTASTAKFMGIVAVFSLGLLSVICMICRIAMAGLASRPPLIVSWAAAEMATAMIAACLPPLKRLRKVALRPLLGNNPGSHSTSRPRSGSGKRASKGAEMIKDVDDDEDDVGGHGHGHSSGKRSGSIARSMGNLKSILKGSLSTGQGNSQTAGTGWTTDAYDSVVRTRTDFDAERGMSEESIIMGGLAPPRRLSRSTAPISSEVTVPVRAATTVERSRSPSQSYSHNNHHGGSAFWSRWRSRSNSASSLTGRRGQQKSSKLKEGLQNRTFGESKMETTTISQIDEENDTSSPTATRSPPMPTTTITAKNSHEPMLGGCDSEREERIVVVQANRRPSASPGFGFLDATGSRRGSTLRDSSSMEGNDGLSIEPVESVDDTRAINRRSFGSIFGS